MMCRHLLPWLMLSCCVTCLQPAYAQTLGDSTEVHCAAEQFKVGKLAVPTAMIAVGTFGIHNGWFRQVKNDVREGFTDLRHDHYIHIDDYTRYLPVISNVGLGLVGVKGRHTLRERLATTATAYVIMGTLCKGMKLAFREERPDGDDHKSFPSGHTATAFMGAELVRQEYGGICGWTAYGIATATAFLRLYNDRHWLNDVIGGAGIGILSAQAAYWLLPLERQILGWKSDSRSLTLIPTYDGYSFSLAATVSF